MYKHKQPYLGGVSGELQVLGNTKVGVSEERGSAGPLLHELFHSATVTVLYTALTHLFLNITKQICEL